MAAAKDAVRLLVLDDEDSLRRNVGRMLKRFGYEVLEASSAQEARQVLESSAGPVALLLCDLNLVGLPGREAAIMLQARRPEMRVLFMSGSTEADFRTELEGSEPVFLAKPFTLAELRAAVEKALS